MRPRKRSTRTWILLAIVAATASGQSEPKAPARKALDWSASRRWVHIDNVDPAKVELFENARRRWLGVLRTKEGRLDDGRPLFWMSRAENVRTYLTFHPFNDFAELDVRRETAAATNKLVGEEAVKQYNECDAALVAPHLSQVWRRSPSLDYVPPEAADLDELTAAAGRIEFQEEDIQQEERTRALWKTLREALGSRRHPVACRTFWSEFGTGELVRVWLARDAATLRDAPSLESQIVAALGEDKGKALLAEYAKLVVTRRSLMIERRPDLANLED